MAQKRRYSTPKDPRRTHPALRDSLRRRVFSMSDGVCAVCGREIDLGLPAGSPLSPELDEIIPVSRGGSPYDIDNLQVLHRVCNAKKSNKMPGDIVPDKVNPLPISRDWFSKPS